MANRGRPAEPDAQPAVARTSETVAWAAGIFQIAGKIDYVPITVPAPALDLRLRVQFLEVRAAILARLLGLFGGRIHILTVKGNGERRYEWAVRGSLAREALPLLIPFFDPTFKAEALTALAVVGMNVTPSDVPLFGVGSTAPNATAGPVVEVPKIEILVPPDFDENIFAYADALDPGTSIVYGFPDVETLTSFLDEASVRSYEIERVENTLRLSKPDGETN